MTVENQSQKKGFLTPRRLRLLIVFILLVAWGILNYTHGHPAYALYIIAFFFVSLMMPKPSFTLVVVTAIAFIVVSSNIVAAFRSIHETTGEAITRPGTYLEYLFTPGSGVEVLPEQAQQVLEIINKNGITSYEISPLLNEDYHIMQRIVESAWPARRQEGATNFFVTMAELPVYEKCDLVDQAEEVALVHCP